MNADEHRALDDLLDHIYEHGTTGEGVTLLTEKLLDSKRADIDRQRAANARLVTQIADQLEEIERLREAVQERDGVIERVLLRELRLREAITEANEAMRDGSDLTAWAILVVALAGKEGKP